MKKENNVTTLKKVIATICGLTILITVIYLYYFNNHMNKIFIDYQTATYHGMYMSSNPLNPKKKYLLINNYSEYKSIIDKAYVYGWTNLEYKYNSDFFINNSLVFVEILETGATTMGTKLLSLQEYNNSVNIEIYENTSGDTAEDRGVIYFLPVSKEITTANIKYVNKISHSKDETIGSIIILICTVVFLIISRKKK